jgi:hypothetical protein
MNKSMWIEAGEANQFFGETTYIRGRDRADGFSVAMRPSPHEEDFENQFN